MYLCRSSSPCRLFFLLYYLYYYPSSQILSSHHFPSNYSLLYVFILFMDGLAYYSLSSHDHTPLYASFHFPDYLKPIYITKHSLPPRSSLCLSLDPSQDIPYSTFQTIFKYRILFYLFLLCSTLYSLLLTGTKTSLSVQRSFALCVSSGPL